MKKIILLIVGLLLVVTFSLVLLNENKTPTNYQIKTRVGQTVRKTVGEEKAVGWVVVPGTNIDYPIIYEPSYTMVDEDDYLWIKHLPSGNENRLAIFGHNVRNVSSKPLVDDESMVRFEQLMAYVYYDFAKEHQYIQLTRNGEDYLYKIFAVSYDTEELEYGGYSKDEETTQTYIERVREMSLYNFDVEVNPSDDIISLITCTRMFGLSNVDQFRIDARRIRNDEKPEPYNVETTDNYVIIK